MTAAPTVFESHAASWPFHGTLKILRRPRGAGSAVVASRAGPTTMRRPRPTTTTPLLRLCLQDKGKRPVEEDEEDYISSEGDGSEAEVEEVSEEQQQQLPECGEAGPADAAAAESSGCPAEPALSPRCDSEPGDLTCAICLGGIPLENMAMVKVGEYSLAVAGWLAGSVARWAARGRGCRCCRRRPLLLIRLPLPLLLLGAACTAVPQGCDHMYCATCILHWALHKEEPWCPQCKNPFSYLLTYRNLDGTLQVGPGGAARGS
jgi:hypothetical protein